MQSTNIDNERTLAGLTQFAQRLSNAIGIVHASAAFSACSEGLPEQKHWFHVGELPL
jgi:hypothetical protein